MQNITILGATGSIGQSTLDVVRRNSDRYSVFALTANRQVDLIVEQCREFSPLYAVMADSESAKALSAILRREGLPTEALSGVDGLRLVSAHDDVDMVMAAIVGAAGLLPTLAAVEAGKRILLANKESLVMAGALFMDAVQRHGAELLPIDSEHNAIYQCLPVNYGAEQESSGVRRILLTASGGPFRTTELDALQAVTPEQACAHPNWPMGRKISVDSATMMNKGLEAIEACWLFGLQPDDVEVVIHPQSIIHSMVDYVDGSVLAQMGNPDMRTPIAYGMAWPGRIDSGVDPLDLVKMGRLDFEAPDYKRFPCLQLAFDAVSSGGTAMAILNAANEVAVDAFLNHRIGFCHIAELNREVLEVLEACPADDLQTVLDADRSARQQAQALITQGKYGWEAR
ncbi:1-deoxy-D-xylulose-5-phosphate reductoisomerase [Aestuariirhabdus sp. Z084]|uniref:1-deoxy-D-xylulose-5-phosphate reductoisomerase n=1 Tax=Aestuariirhabdus haliotis TaxID=2918751 RepID=UPI00201B3E55|nr:1-deoxy-D-xylulose-5-phosphate reductoisomerase [Aestuariirhabdus haliotis]MCL6416379.1 1-deoxy-D-xylulose-5-phosphate reductoisomerase [Aestuariirhabdus haliotis]MCL6420368.1 1-deoxy-D-xylulose-5-phosphate reductoisomerase [Aestuariirhabdus haliotis]